MIDVRAILFTLIIGWGLLMISPVAYAQDADVVPVTPTTLSLPASPQSSSIKELSNLFYKRCLTKPDPTLSELDNEEYCICLSAQMYNKSLTPEERGYLAYGQGTPLDKKRLYGEVYGPCLSIPARVAEYRACTHDPKVYKLVKNTESADLMCRCVSNELTYFWETEVPAFLRLGKSYRRDFDDPVAYIRNGRDYPSRYAEAQSKCVSAYGRRD